MSVMPTVKGATPRRRPTEAELAQHPVDDSVLEALDGVPRHLLEFRLFDRYWRRARRGHGRHVDVARKLGVSTKTVFTMAHQYGFDLAKDATDEAADAVVAGIDAAADLEIEKLKTAGARDDGDARGSADGRRARAGAAGRDARVSRAPRVP